LVRDLLRDPATAGLLSDEGPIAVNSRLLAAQVDTSPIAPARND